VTRNVHVKSVFLKPRYTRL